MCTVINVDLIIRTLILKPILKPKLTNAYILITAYKLETYNLQLTTYNLPQIQRQFKSEVYFRFPLL